MSNLYRPIEEWDKNSFVEEVCKKVFNGEEQAEALFYTLQIPGHNLLLYGPGGYAKSMLLEVGLSLVTADFYQDVYLTMAAPGMAMEPFIGYIDLKTWKETGHAEYHLDKTIYLCGKKYGIMEEGLSAPPKVTLSLRDALTRRFLCVNGVQCMPLTLQHFFIATNVYPDKWVKALPVSEREGGEAVLKRFHRQVETKWTDHSAAVWAKFFQHQFGQETLLAEMLGEAWQAGHQIDPRAAHQMYGAYTKNGIGALKNFSGVSPEAYEIFQKVEARFPYISSIKKAEMFVQEATTMVQEKTVTKTALQTKTLELVKLQSELKTLKIPSDAKYTERLSKVLNALNQLSTSLINAISTAPERASITLNV